MDGMMLADKLIDRFGDARVVVNDLLMHLEPLRPLWIPVNKHGSQNSLYARKFDEEFFGELPILTFPAGLCSRCIGGEVTDLPWKTNFLKKAYASQRQIVPVFVEGRLSNFFYRVDRIRRMLGVKFNIEMLWLSDEMFSQKGKHFRILVGDPIPVAELQRYGALRDQADYVRKKAYFLENMLLPAENNGQIGIFVPSYASTRNGTYHTSRRPGIAPRRAYARAQSARHEEGRERDLYLPGVGVPGADA